MAARTGMGVGLGITITILSLACLTLFITTIMFLAQKQRAQTELADMRTSMNAFVRSGEREADEVKAIVQAAAAANKSAIGHLRDSLGEAVSRVTGVRTDTVDQMRAKLQRINAHEGANLIQVINDRNAQIARLQASVQQAEAAAQRAQTDLRNEVERVQALERTHTQTLAALTQQLEAYKGEVDTYRTRTIELQNFMNAQIERARQAFEAEKDALTAQLLDAKTTVATLQDQLNKLKATRTETLRPTDEFALVDGEVIGVNPSENQVFINIGRRDKVVLGMRFSVYASASAIRPDAEGNYPRGKAIIEVVRIDQNQSVCRVVPGSEIRGNPIIRGDVIANPLYDPRKVYKFVVFGNFDPEGTGVATPAGRDRVSALITQWGGQVIGELAGDVDFLVLGERPMIPPPPPPTAPFEIVREYMRLRGEADEYDRLQAQAIATSVPILNQNRLRTLIGN